MRHLPLLLALVMCTASPFADVITTLDGEEIAGTIVAVDSTSVRYTPSQPSTSPEQSIPRSKIFMVKYADGRKLVMAKSTPQAPVQPAATHRYGANVLFETGLFGLVNVNEEHFDAGVVTFGVTPSLDVRINRFLVAGLEYMILWAQPKKADEARFIMNCNALSRLTFPLTEKFTFLAQVTAGLSIWPEGKGVYTDDTTFFKERIGWDLHGGIGIEYKTCSRGSIVFCAGYNANFSMREEMPITVDMLILSVGPRIRF